MKRIIFWSLPLMAIVILVAAGNYSPVSSAPQDEVDLDWPEEVITLLENSCYDCHTKAASNVKSKGKLNFSKWGDYKLTKQIGKLNDISETVKEQKMPPKKYVGKYPDKAFSEEEIKLIVDWANQESDKLMGE